MTSIDIAEVAFRAGFPGWADMSADDQEMLRAAIWRAVRAVRDMLAHDSIRAEARIEQLEHDLMEARVMRAEGES